MPATSTVTRTSLANPWQMTLGALLRGLKVGELTVTLPGRSDLVFGGTAPGPSARVTVNDSALARRLVLGTDVALAESYMDGQWDTPDLRAVLELGLANRQAGWMSGIPVVLRPVHRAKHRSRDNDPEQGARRNIEHHYDLGNDFYQLWLDETMTYSSACFDGTDDLAQAQRRKWDRMLELTDPKPGAHLLEIGCGWGGFAIHAAKTAGCRVTGLTLSTEQAAFARRRIEEEGLADLVDIRLQDYRHTQGLYDGIVSIEMFEAVGEAWWSTFFGQVSNLLKPTAAAAIQTITIADETFEAYRRRPDFIQLYVFPGGMLPSIERFQAGASAAGLRTRHIRSFGGDYSRTLREWSARFEQALSTVKELGYDERFIRMWRYYLAYCDVGFTSGNTNVVQVRLDASRAKAG